MRDVRRKTNWFSNFTEPRKDILNNFVLWSVCRGMKEFSSGGGIGCKDKKGSYRKSIKFKSITKHLDYEPFLPLTIKVKIYIL